MKSRWTAQPRLARAIDRQLRQVPCCGASRLPKAPPRQRLTPQGRPCAIDAAVGGQKRRSKTWCSTVKLDENTVVFATVYRCRFHGERLKPDAIRTNALCGDLIVHRRGMGRIANCSRLMGALPHTALRQGMASGRPRARDPDCRPRALPGRNDKQDGPVYPQAYWCIPSSRPVVKADQRPQRLREAAEIGRTMVNHYARRRG